MPNPNGNPGNKGGRRKSAYQERQDAIWHDEKWRIETDVPVLKAKLETGKYSVRDVFLAKALQGNERILGIFANKLLPDLHDHTSKGQRMGIPILGVNQNDAVSSDESPAEDSGA